MKAAMFDNTGYIVFRGAGGGDVAAVFKTRDDCEAYRDASGLSRFPVVEVMSAEPFRWISTTGCVPGLMKADTLFEVTSVIGALGA